MKTTIQNSLRIEGPLSGLLNSQVTDQMSFLSLAKMIAEQASNPNGDKNIKALKHALSAKGALGKIARGGAFDSDPAISLLAAGGYLQIVDALRTEGRKGSLALKVRKALASKDSLVVDVTSIQNFVRSVELASIRIPGFQNKLDGAAAELKSLQPQLSDIARPFGDDPKLSRAKCQCTINGEDAPCWKCIIIIIVVIVIVVILA